MYSFVVTFVLVACTNAAPHKSSALPRLDGRIVGGDDVSIEDYPYQVSLQYYGSHICGGSIIAENYVVTAAHCTDGTSASSLSIRAGSSIRNYGGVLVPVSSIIRNPAYNPWTIDSDISVLKLSVNLTYGSGVRNLSLPNQNEEVSAGTPANVTGWGNLFEGGSYLPGQLQGVEVPVVSREACSETYGPGSVTPTMICAGVPQGGKDACQGDSGGPLVVLGKLIGIVSWGYGCARPSLPGVYSNVAALRSFVASVSGI